MLLRNQKRANRPEVRGEILVFADPRQSRDWLAGAEGIEPSNAGIKIQCLTTWRRPKAVVRPGPYRGGDGLSTRRKCRKAPLECPEMLALLVGCGAQGASL